MSRRGGPRYRALMQQWRQGGPYPYDVSWPLMHRAWSVTLGAAYALAVVGQARVGLTHMEVVDAPACLSTARGAILVCWHRWASVAIELAWWLRVHGGLHGRQMWLNWWAPRMGPTHVLCEEWAGVEMAPTGTPTLSRASADTIADLMRSGDVVSTLVMPDGPTGPAGHFRRGALHMALRSGAPLVPLHISGRGHYCTHTWDRKRLQTPGSRVRVQLGEPVFVRSASEFDSAQHRIVAQMD